VILHGEGGDVEGVQALDHVVVQVDVAHLDPAEARRRLHDALGRGVDRETVVVRGDLDSSGGLVDHGLVDAAVAERQFVRAEAERAAEQLVAEADAEERQPFAQHGRQQFDMAVRGFRIARAVGEEDRAGLQGEQFGDRDLLGNDMHLETAGGEVVEGGRLHSEVEDGDGTDPLPLRRDAEQRRGGDHRREVEAGHLGRAEHQGELLLVGQCGVRAGEDAGTHRPGVPKPPGHRPRVYAADPNDPLLDELVVESARGPEVRDDPGGIAHGEAGDPDPRGLPVHLVHTGVADVRCRHEHDLPRIGRVGDGLLVPRHPGGEHGLAEGAPAGSVRLTAVTAPVLEHEYGRFTACH